MKKFLLVVIISGLLFIRPEITIPAEPFHLHFPPLNYQPPSVEHFALPSGIQVFFLEDHELPLVRISVYVKAGSMYDPVGKEGLSELTAQVMRMGGTETRTGDEIDRRFEYLAAIVEPHVYDEYVSWELDVPSKDLTPVWSLFSDLMKRPVFAPEKIKTASAVKREEIKRISDYPDKLAFREFKRLYYQGSVRGRIATPTSIDTISRDDLVAFHQRHYFPANMMIAVSGDISREKMVSLLTEPWNAGWENCPPPPPIPPPTWHPCKKSYCLMKDIPQAVIITGQPAPPKTNADFYPFEILDFILGSGGFRSHIFQEVRTKRGLSYSTGSIYRSQTDYGVFMTYALTHPDKAALTLSVIKQILMGAKKGVDPMDVERAKRALVNSFVFEYTFSHKIATRSLEITWFRWPEDLWSRYVERIERISVEEINRVARDYLRPEDMLVVSLTTKGNCDAVKPICPEMEEREVAP